MIPLFVIKTGVTKLQIRLIDIPFHLALLATLQEQSQVYKRNMCVLNWPHSRFPSDYSIFFSEFFHFRFLPSLDENLTWFQLINNDMTYFSSVFEGRARKQCWSGQETHFLCDRLELWFIFAIRFLALSFSSLSLCRWGSAFVTNFNGR